MSIINSTGGWNPRSRCGAKSVEPIISINAKYGRLYFSAYAVRRLQLYSAAVKVEIQNKEWVLVIDRKHSHWKLTQYQGAFYLVHRAMVDEIMSAFNTDNVSFLIMDTDDNKNSIYHLTAILDRPSKKRRKHNITTNNARRKAEVVSATKVLTKYESSDFNGRIKTQEVAKAETVLKHTRR